MHAHVYKAKNKISWNNTPAKCTLVFFLLNFILLIFLSAWYDSLNWFLQTTNRHYLQVGKLQTILCLKSLIFCNLASLSLICMIRTALFSFFFFLWYWGLNSGPCTCLADTLPLGPCPQPKDYFLIENILSKVKKLIWPFIQKYLSSTCNV
jgi:hypothetical protein